MLSEEAFQKLLFDLFCMWHDVQRHYDPPITHTEEEKMYKVRRIINVVLLKSWYVKVKQMICKLLGEIDSRVNKIKEFPAANDEQVRLLIESFCCDRARWNGKFRDY